jgi:hypothetical protein
MPGPGRSNPSGLPKNPGGIAPVGKASGDTYQPWDETQRPYADIPDGPRVGPYLKFTPAQRKQFLDANKARSGDGQVRSDLSGKVLPEGKAQVDHVRSTFERCSEQLS